MGVNMAGLRGRISVAHAAQGNRNSRVPFPPAGFGIGDETTPVVDLRPALQLAGLPWTSQAAEALFRTIGSATDSRFLEGICVFGYVFG